MFLLCAGKTLGAILGGLLSLAGVDRAVNLNPLFVGFGSPDVSSRDHQEQRAPEQHGPPPRLTVHALSGEVPTDAR